MFQTKVVEKINTHFTFNKFFLFCILRDNVKKYGATRQATDDTKMRYMRFACWVNKASDKRSDYAILIAIPRQQRLRERVSMLRYTYTASFDLSSSKTPQVLLHFLKF
jgi:hypothetical protein